jgi:hypothetical protein
MGREQFVFPNVWQARWYNVGTREDTPPWYLPFTKFGSRPSTMNALTALEACLEEALAGVSPVAAEAVQPRVALGHVLAEAVVLPGDRPATHEALRSGFAVARA